MSDEVAFQSLIRCVRLGDDQAAAELIRQYEPLIRREIRIHLVDRQLRRIFDSLDICQAVWASFFVRSAAGQYDLDQPEQVLRLLVNMTRNKLASAARAEHRQRRDQRRHRMNGQPTDCMDAADTEPTPSAIVSSRELLDRCLHCLTDEERQLAQLRAEGHSWQEIADRLGGAAQARRMQLSRAINRAMQITWLGIMNREHGSPSRTGHVWKSTSKATTETDRLLAEQRRLW